MPDEHDRSRIEVDRADRALIQQAAAQLRHGAIRAGYAGMEHKHLAFALALVLDELGRHLRDLRPEVRAQTVRGRPDAARRGDDAVKRVLGGPSTRWSGSARRAGRARLALLDLSTQLVKGVHAHRHDRSRRGQLAGGGRERR